MAQSHDLIEAKRAAPSPQHSLDFPADPIEFGDVVSREDLSR
jgi:hypothetical protein